MEPARTVERSRGAVATSPVDLGAWVVQGGSYNRRADAEPILERLRGGGFRAYISGRSGDGRVRVRVVPSAGESAPALAARLGEHGYDTWTTRE